MFGEWKLPRVQETFLRKTIFFKIDSSTRKLQESRNKQNKIQKKYVFPAGNCTYQWYPTPSKHRLIFLLSDQGQGHQRPPGSSSGGDACFSH